MQDLFQRWMLDRDADIRTPAPEGGAPDRPRDTGMPRTGSAFRRVVVATVLPLIPCRPL